MRDSAIRLIIPAVSHLSICYRHWVNYLFHIRFASQQGIQTRIVASDFFKNPNICGATLFFPLTNTFVAGIEDMFNSIRSVASSRHEEFQERIGKDHAALFEEGTIPTENRDRDSCIRAIGSYAKVLREYADTELHIPLGDKLDVVLMTDSGVDSFINNEQIV